MLAENTCNRLLLTIYAEIAVIDYFLTCNALTTNITS